MIIEKGVDEQLTKPLDSERGIGEPIERLQYVLLHVFKVESLTVGRAQVLLAQFNSRVEGVHFFD